MKDIAIAQVLSLNLDLLDHGDVFALSDIRNEANYFLQKENSDILVQTKDVRKYLTKYFNHPVEICDFENKNKPSLFFLSHISKQQMARSLYEAKSTKDDKNIALKLREVIKKVDFDLDDRVCDHLDLREAWENIRIPDELLSFFSTLFDFDVNEFNAQSVHQNYFEDDSTEKLSKMDNLKLRMKTMFQMFYFIIHKGQKKNSAPRHDRSIHS